MTYSPPEHFDNVMCLLILALLVTIFIASILTPIFLSDYREAMRNRRAARAYRKLLDERDAAMHERNVGESDAAKA